MPIDAGLTATVLTVLTPALTQIGTGAAREVGKKAVEAGEKLLDWLMGTLTGQAATALADLQADPASDANRQVFGIRLDEFLTANPHRLADLKTLLAAAAPENAAEQRIDGNDNKAAAVAGHGNTVTIS